MNCKIYLLDHFADSNPIYTSWTDASRYRYVVVKSQPDQWIPPEDAGIVVTHQHYQWDTFTTLRRIRTENPWLPILILSDGILEFRNTFENPTIAEGCIFQPLVGHKLACLGRAPARHIEALGNAGKCEIVGHPRFDRMAESPRTPIQADGPFRLLITTARTPAFNTQQRQLVTASLKALKLRFDRSPWVGRRHAEVSWRLPPSLADSLGIQGATDQCLEDAIEMSDAVITTPSTVFLESLIKHRPTALLDFTNSPSYVPSAWTISAPAHINPVLDQLAKPPAAKLAFQQRALRDQLELGGNSATRMATLIHQMIQAGQQARVERRPLQLPPRILSDPQRGIAHVEDDFDLQSLYPDSVVYPVNDQTLLKQELAHAIARLDQLPRELQQKNEDLDLKDQHIEAMELELQSAEQRITESLERQQELAQSIERQREDLERRATHIEELNAQLQKAVAERKMAFADLRDARIGLNQLTNQSQQQQAALAQVLKQLTDAMTLQTGLQSGGQRWQLPPDELTEAA